MKGWGWIFNGLSFFGRRGSRVGVLWAISDSRDGLCRGLKRLGCGVKLWCNASLTFIPAVRCDQSLNTSLLVDYADTLLIDDGGNISFFVNDRGTVDTGFFVLVEAMLFLRLAVCLLRVPSSPAGYKLGIIKRMSGRKTIRYGRLRRGVILSWVVHHRRVFASVERYWRVGHCGILCTIQTVVKRITSASSILSATAGMS